MPILPKKLGFFGPQVITPGSPFWEKYAEGFAAAPDYANSVPAGVVVCKTAQDAQKAVAFAQKNHLPIRIRGGRHNYEGHSSRVKDGLIIDIRGLNTLTIGTDGLVTAGAGTNMFELTEALNQHNLAMPYATGGTVGLAGFLLGGGVGVNSRLWGLGSTHVEGFDIVLADSKLYTITPTSDPDLFWAVLGGGGGNFGIVTSFTLKAHPLQKVGVLSITWDWQHFLPLVDTWQKQLLAQPRELTTFLTLRVNGSIELSGQWTDDNATEETIRQALAPLLAVAEPKQCVIQCIPHTFATRLFFRASEDAPQGWHAKIGQQLFKSTSSFAYNPLPQGALEKLKQHLEAHPTLQTTPEEESMIRLLGGGGATQDTPPHPIAKPHEQSLFILQYDGYWQDRQDAEQVRAWTNQARTVLLPYTIGAYSNYTDDELPITEQAQLYYGDLAPRLIAIKKRVDPTNFFSFPHSLPL